jgi:hypothetical protein
METTDQERQLVTVNEPETMNILGLLMRGLLSDNLSKPRNLKRGQRMKGDIAVKAGKMTVTLRFVEGHLTIIRGETEKPRARVGGDMSTLLGVVTGKGMVWPFLTGKLKIGGNPFVLLKMLPFIKAG